MEFLIGEWEVFSLRDFNKAIRIEWIYLTFQMEDDKRLREELRFPMTDHETARREMALFFLLRFVKSHFNEN